MESALEKELRINKGFECSRRMQEARIIAPDIIEYVEDLEARIKVLEYATSALISQNVRRELRQKEKSAISAE